jgi:DNA-binding winged helix-turn-helix (wHTH) protein/tetratricopeptide (TPR) repeat protein
MTVHALGPFRLDTRDDVLLRGTEPVVLGRRAVTLLRALVERPGALVSKDALIEAAWPGVAVEDNNLTVQIAALRRALSEVPGGDRWIETMPRRGYRFVGPIVASAEKGGATPPVDAPRDAEPAQHGEAERRQVTILSCELIGTAGRAGGMDLEDLNEAVGNFRRCVAEAASRHTGFLYRHLGNDALVLYGYPEAHEDDAERAVRAGLELCAAVRVLRPEAEAPLRCRIGIATGLVIIGDPAEAEALRGQGIVGDVPGVAARLLASAPPDAVAIDPATRCLIGNLFDGRDLGVIETDGVAEPVRGWQVLGESLVASRFEALRGTALTPLVGRGEEIDVLLRRWARAKAGEGQIVLVSGEAGIGKSRLTAALAERLQDEPHLRLRYFCAPERQGSALFPFIDQLGRASGLARDDPPATRLGKLEAMLARAALPDEDVALLSDLLSLPASERHPLPNLTPQKKKERTLEALIRQIEGLSRQQPILTVFEDAQWIDPTSRELLDLAVERLRTLPVMLIVTFRPEFQPPWIGQSRVTMLTLDRLDRHDRSTLVGQIAGGKALPGEIIARIADRTDGVPLFVEELTKSVLESGLLHEERDRYILDGIISSVTIPTSLNFSLMARLDRLGSARLVAQIGAVIGREFSYPLLLTVSRLPEDELQAALDRLVASGLAFRRGTPPEAVYIFKHALVQDAAQGSLLRAQRQQLHTRIGQVLEEQFPEIAETQSEILAYHFTEAGLREIAIGYWQKAGERALMHSANAEAVEHLKHGIALTHSLPEGANRNNREFALQLLLGPALRVIRGHSAPETEQAFSRAHDLLDERATVKERMTVLYGLWAIHNARAEHSAGCALAERCVALASCNEDEEAIVLADRVMGLSLFFMGRFAEAQHFLERAIDLSSRARLTDLRFSLDHGVGASMYLSFTLWPLGYPDQAVDMMTQALARARVTEHAMTLALALTGALVPSVAFGAADPEQARALTDEAVAYCTERRVAGFAPFARFFQAIILAQQGDAAAAAENMHRALDALKEIGAEYLRSMLLGHLAQTLVQAGQVALAEELLDEAVRLVESTHERFFEAELYRMRGDLLARLGESGNARTALEQALAVARGQQARMWELRAAVSLAQLSRDQGRRAEARDLLAPVHAWFTEGFDTPDLEKAKALLDELT